MKSIQTTLYFTYRFFAVIILIILFIGMGYGQMENQSPIKIDIIPPSPNALALGKYGEIPVNHYTGVPSINIPLFTVGSHKSSLPVSLSYHAGGFRVTENASWVGLGWSLNAGGVITRTVRGMPDEKETDLHRGFNLTRGQVKSYYTNAMNAQQQLLFLTGLADGMLDGEPDEYFFNFNGKSGRFVFDDNGTPLIIPAQNIKISLINNDINQGFEVIDEMGTIYTFDANEMTVSTDACELIANPSFSSSWFMTSIRPLVGDTIYLSYDSGLTYQNLLPSESIYTLEYGGNGCSIINLRDCAKESKIMTKRLSQINWTGGKIIFKANTKRTDLFGQTDEYRLDGIEVLGKQLIKKINFIYEENGTQRLVLSKISEIDLNNPTATKDHVFSYNRSYSLPPVTSKAQDHWGFYNSNSGVTLVPKDVLASINGPRVLSGADRSPDAGRTQAGILTQIKYPTGGTVNFSYELNDYGYINRNAVQEYERIAASVNLDVNSENQYAYDSFAIDTTQVVSFYSAVNVSPDGIDEVHYNESVYVKDSNGKIIYSSIGKIDNTEIELKPGVYEVYATHENPTTRTSITIWYQKSTGVMIKAFPTGGLRIKKIVQQEGNNIIGTDEYLYRMENEPDRSSGTFVGKPIYSYRYTTQATGGGGCSHYVRTSMAQTLGSTKGGHVGYRFVRNIKNGEAITDYTFTSFFDYPESASGFPFASQPSSDYNRGLPLSIVQRKKVGDQIRNVHAEYNKYISKVEGYKQFVGLKVGYSKRFNPVQLNDLAVAPLIDVSEWVVKDSNTTISYDLMGNETAKIATKYYYDNPRHLQQTRVEKGDSKGLKYAEFTFYPDDYSNGNTSINAMKSNHAVALPIEQVFARKNGNQLNVTSANLFEYDLSGKGMLEKYYVAKIDNPVLGIAFKFSNRLLGTVPPTGTLSNYQPDNRYELSSQVSLYDSYGNPREVKKKLEASSVYLWGYSGQYPIVEIKNATYAEVALVLTQATIDNLNVSTHSEATMETLIKNASDKLRTSLPQTMVTSYTYKPLVGMTSKTDARGVKETYKYDGMQRLQAILDQVGHVTKAIDYHYRPN